MRPLTQHTHTHNLRRFTAFGAALAIALPVGAAKLTVSKPTEEPPPGKALEHRPVDLSALGSHGGRLIAEYPTFYLVELPDGATAAFLATMERKGVTARPRPEFSRFSVNHYEFVAGGPLPGAPPALELDDYHGESGLYLIQLIGPNRPEWWDAMTKLGEPIHYYAENAFLVRGKPGLVAAAKADPAFQLAAVYQPAYKIQRGLLDFVGVLPVIVQLDGGQDLSGVTAMLADLNGGQVSFEAEGPLRNPLVWLTAAEVRAFASLPEVISIGPALEARPSDERQALVVAGRHNGSQPTQPRTYDAWLLGKGFCTTTGAPPGCYSAQATVAVFDTGLDSNVCSTSDPLCPGGTKVAHPDLATRETRFYCANRSGYNACLNYPYPPGTTGYNYTDWVAHGTAVSSIIAGDPLRPGTGVEAKYRIGRDSNGFYLGSGIAPLAKILTFRIWDASGAAFRDYFNGWYPPSDFDNWYAQLPAYPDTRFTNNSWNMYMTGTDWDLEYNEFSQKFDWLVRDANGGFNDYQHPMTIVFSAGNKTDLHPDQYVVSPANAKNVIAVGAAESYRVSDVAPWNNFDCMVAADIRNIASFSKRTPLYDPNRYKPDLVAGGTRLGAAFTRSGHAGYPSCIVAPPPGDPNGQYYTRFWGTSGAAPVVTGAAVLVDEWYYRRQGSVRPTPAMIKALLAAHAADLVGGFDRMTGYPNLHRPWPPLGWGRVSLDSLFQAPVPAIPVRFYDEDHTTQGTRRFVPGEGSWTVNLTVPSPASEVLLVLSFTDRYAPTGASPSYVNNLDLYVIDGSYNYQGNNFDPDGYTYRATGGGFPDFDNTIEMIRIRPGELLNNDFTVEVVPGVNMKAVPGLDGASANQDFALYIFNAQ